MLPRRVSRVGNSDTHQIRVAPAHATRLHPRRLPGWNRSPPPWARPCPARPRFAAGRSPPAATPGSPAFLEPTATTARYCHPETGAGPRRRTISPRRRDPGAEPVPPPDAARQARPSPDRIPGPSTGGGHGAQTHPPGPRAPYSPMVAAVRGAARLSRLPQPSCSTQHAAWKVPADSMGRRSRPIRRRCSCSPRFPAGRPRPRHAKKVSATHRKRRPPARREHAATPP